MFDDLELVGGIGGVCIGVGVYGGEVGFVGFDVVLDDFGLVGVSYGDVGGG